MAKCPFTHQNIDSIVPFDVAILHHSQSQNKAKVAPDHKHKNDDSNTSRTDTNEVTTNTGCVVMCSLTYLVDHLYSNSHDNTIPSIPFNHKFDTIYDGISHMLLLGDDEEKDDDMMLLSKQYDVVSFKFNKHLYHLTVLKNETAKNAPSFAAATADLIQKTIHHLKNILNTTFHTTANQQQQQQQQQQQLQTDIDMDELAQERIGKVLGINSKQNMKILHKGKVLYPSNDPILTPEQISQNLVQISKSDFQNKKRKHNPSLIIMGTRRNDMIAAERRRNPSSNRGLVKDWLRKKILNNRYSYYIVSFLFGIFVYKLKRPGRLMSFISSNNDDEL